MCFVRMIQYNRPFWYSTTYSSSPGVRRSTCLPSGIHQFSLVPKGVQRMNEYIFDSPNFLSPVNATSSIGVFDCEFAQAKPGADGEHWGL